MPASVSPPIGPPITHGVAAGEVTATSAVLWARCERASRLHVAAQAERGDEIAASTAVTADDDFTGAVTIDGLQADTRYAYRAWCAGDSVGDSVGGTFRTAPDPHAYTPITFAWGGDIGGQNVCRDRIEGYPIFQSIARQQLDFFIGLGDMIYADNPCFAIGTYGNAQVPGPPNAAADLPGFWAYWKYNRDDDALRRLLAATPYYAVWDDHEVQNDFGPEHDTGPTGQHLLPLGRKAFVDYNPIARGADGAPRLYRSVRWGQHLELFILDTRRDRDPNSAIDDPRHPKTMLGREQLAWLKDSLRDSDATWKVIVSSVPLSIPTGSAEYGRDGWANFDQRTGFEHELIDILRFMQRHSIANNVWISTDIHFAAAFRHTPFRDAPAFHAYEVDTGPLNAGVFAKRDFDSTLGTKLLFRHPQPGISPQGFQQAKSWFNFGVLHIDAAGALQIEIINTNGDRLYELTLRPR